MIVSRAEFCEIAGCTNANISTWLGRGKIVINENGLIDTETRENKDFLEKRKALGKGTISIGAVSATPILRSKNNHPIPEYVPEPIGVKSKRAQQKIEKTTVSKYEVDLQKSIAELEKKKVDTDLARQKLSILTGNNIPISVVKEIISQLSRAMINNYKSFSEQSITEFCHKYKIDESERVKLLDSNIKGINSIHMAAVNDATTQLKNSIGSTQINESIRDENDAD